MGKRRLVWELVDMDGDVIDRKHTSPEEVMSKLLTRALIFELLRREADAEVLAEMPTEAVLREAVKRLNNESDPLALDVAYHIGRWLDDDL